MSDKKEKNSDDDLIEAINYLIEDMEDRHEPSGYDRMMNEKAKPMLFQERFNLKTWQVTVINIILFVVVYPGILYLLMYPLIGNK